MLHSTSGLRRLMKRPANYVPNEVIITTVPEARNDSLPHHVNVAAEVVPAATRYGDVNIDGILQRLGVRTRSIGRVFVPRPVVSTMAPGASMDALARMAVAANYEEEEHVQGLSRTYRVTFDAEVQVPLVCQELSASNAIEGARPNYIAEVYRRPTDEFYGYQWGPQAIGCEAAWDVETGHPNVVIAIVDSGVDIRHEDIAAKLVQGYDAVDMQGNLGPQYIPLGDYRTRDRSPRDEDGHGTHCAGIAAGAANNGRGIAGVCWGGRIVPVRVMFRVFDRLAGRETSVGTDADIDTGIKFAVDAGAQVINLSLGGAEPSHESVLRYAYDRNVCVVAATGNDNTSDPSYPASNAHTLAVGAVDSNLNRASFSNYGPAYNQFVMAPGVNIASTYKDNGYVYLDGTSMATPFVTGMVGLIVSLALRRGARLPVADMYAIIRDTATPRRTGKGDLFYGAGLVNAPAALEAARQRLGG